MANPGAAQAQALAANGMHDSLVHESTWDEVFPLLDAHFFQLVPAHLYERFLDHVSWDSQDSFKDCPLVLKGIWRSLA